MTHLGDRIAAFVDGQLPDDERRVAEHHVAECDECRHKVREQRLLKSRMTSLGAVEAPEHLLDSLRGVERLAPDPPAEPGWLGRCLRSTSVRVLVAVTGASVTVTALAYGVGGPRHPEEPEVTPAVEQFAAQFEETAPVSRSGDADDVLAPTAETVAASGAEPLTLEPQRVVGADDPYAVGLLREAAGSSPYLEQLVRNYRITIGDTENVGGRSAVEVRAVRAGTVVAGFWVDPLDDAVLRRVLYDEDGAVVDSRDYETSGDSQSAGATGGESAGDDTQIAAETLDALTDSGWPCHELLARDLARVRGHWVDVGDEHAVHLTYTDGLARLSLYEQRGRLDASGLEGFEPHRVDGSTVWLRDGRPRVAVWSARGVVYTAVTDADAHRLRQVVAELPQDGAGDTGPMQRVETGLRRMGSWLPAA